MKLKKEYKQTMEIFRDGIPIFQVLANPTRQDIILLLADKDSMNVTHIARKIPLSRPAISHHLKQLKLVGIVDMEKKGTENYYFITLSKPLKMLNQLAKLIEENCIIR